MQPRGLKNLSQISPDDRFSVVAEGLDALGAHVQELERDAVNLAEDRRHQSAATLRAFADEEAAKIFILLDIVRLGIKDGEVLKSAAAKFYDHLARGIYVRAYAGNPADLDEVRKYAEFLRRNLYLDGPNGVDWVFRNDILSRREEQLYVDWVLDENGDGRWLGPAQREEMEDSWSRFAPPASRAVSLVLEMGRCGLFSVDALRDIDAAWPGSRSSSNPHFMDIRPINETLALRCVGLGGTGASDIDHRALQMIIDGWIFPLLALDLSAIKVSPEELEREREAWLAAEMGL